MDSTMDDSKERNQHCHAESFRNRQLMCHDSWAPTGIRCNLMEELSFCLNPEEIRNIFPFWSLDWRTVLQPQGVEHKVSWGEGQEPLQAPAVEVWELHGWSHEQGSRVVIKRGWAKNLERTPRAWPNRATPGTGCTTWLGLGEQGNCPGLVSHAQGKGQDFLK